MAEVIRNETPLAELPPNPFWLVRWAIYLGWNDEAENTLEELGEENLDEVQFQEQMESLESRASDFGGRETIEGYSIVQARSDGAADDLVGQYLEEAYQLTAADEVQTDEIHQLAHVLDFPGVVGVTEVK